MDVSSTIDWISVTDHAPRDKYPGMVGVPVRTNGLHSYPEGAKYEETGLWAMWHPGRPSMGLHLLYSGETLRRMYNLGTLPDALVTALVGLELHFTRLDMAIDARGLGINLDKIKKAVIRKEYEGRTRHWDNRESSGDGYSLYVGAPSSDRRLRIYDKAAEQCLEATDWKRLECQLRDDVASTIARAFVRGSMGNLHDATWAVADAMLPKLRSQDWREFKRGTTKVGVPSIPRTTDFESWLINQVAPGVKRLSLERPNSPALVALRNALAFGASERGE